MSGRDRGELAGSEYAAHPGDPFGHLRGPDPDPLAAVLALGNRAARFGAVIGIVLALLMHGAASARAVLSLHEMWLAMKTMRDGVHDYLWTMYDVEMPAEDKPKEDKPPEPPPPEPEPEPAPIPKAAPP